MALELFHPGLRGVVAGETEISRLDGGLQYRGYCIHDLAAQSSFLEVAYLLLHEELPTAEELADFHSILVEESQLPDVVVPVFEQLPLHTSAAEALRTGISLIAQHDPQPQDGVVDSAVVKSLRLLARVPLLIATWQRLRTDLPAAAIDPDLSYAANLLLLLTGVPPTLLQERALDAALIVAAEHEFNPSTYTARVVASTHADLYSVVIAALGTLLGPRHGGGNDRILDVLAEAESAGAADDWVRALPEDGEAVPGFGHPVYQDGDPRALILEPWCRELAESRGRLDLEQIADAVERAVWEQRRLPPNLDWPLVRLLHYLNLPPDLHLPVFLCARLAGWCAHAIEQARDGDVIRPRARYRGAEDLAFRPLDERD
jgi:citrate synthase